MRSAAAWLLGGLCLFLCATAVSAEEEAAAPRKPSAAAVQGLYAVLQKAVQTRDYRLLLQEGEGEPLLSWKGSDGEPADLSASELISRLRSEATGTGPLRMEGPSERSGAIVIEMSGWPDPASYRSCTFTLMGLKERRWRLLGCEASTHQEEKSPLAAGEEVQRMLPGLLTDVRKALDARDFGILKRYVPDRRPYFYSPCGTEGGEPIDLDEQEMAGLLTGNSGQSAITFNPFPDESSDSANRMFVTIDTEGWTGEYPFLSFTFSRTSSDAPWRWEGVCYDVLPPVRREMTAERTYFSRPELPRPGPRTFRSVSALRARIAEIVELGQWDALQAYAVTGKLVLGECSQAMRDQDRILGTALPALQVLDFLRKNDVRGSEIEETKIFHATFYETEGWKGEYPYVQFWFGEEQGLWTVRGVTFCKQKLYDVPADDSPWYRKVLRNIFR